VQEFGSLEGILNSTASIKQKARRCKLEAYADQAVLSRVLVELERNVPLEMMTMDEERVPFEKVGDLRAQGLDESRVLAFYDDLGFQETKRRFVNALRRKSNQRSAGGRRAPSSRKASSRQKATLPEEDDYLEVPF